MKPFTIEYGEPIAGDGECAEVRLTGFLDAHTVDVFEQSMNGLLAGPCRRVAISLAALDYISSAGIGAMMVLLQQLRGRGGDLVLFDLTPKVFQVLDLLGFTQIFNIARDRAEALRRLGLTIPPDGSP